MKNYLLPVIITIILACFQSGVIGQPTNGMDNLISIGQRDSLYSDILKEPRELLVYVPQSVGSSIASEARYPVLVLLDGDAHFHSVSGMIKQLSTVNGNTICPEMIIVGIPNTDRTRDLTPTHVGVAFGDSNAISTSGGGNAFLDFIEHEMLPYIEENYPASDYRTIVGHSLGGLMVVNALVRRPHVFDNYVAIDPSLWWDGQMLLAPADSAVTTAGYNEKALYVGVANTMAEGMGISDVVNETTGETEHIRSILQFVKSTEEKKSDEFAFDWKYYGNDSHGSVPLITEYDALRFLYSWYDFRDMNAFYDPESTATVNELINVVNRHYENVSKHMGYQVEPAESLINQLGYMYIQRDDADKAYAFFNMNVQNFPGSANVYDSMGDYYLSQADTVNAIKHFSKAVEVGDLGYSKEKLKMLESED